MTELELNNYIKHYLEKNQTHTAIMLTGEWGSGKTYYVEKVLAPFLKDGKKNRCIVVSLYGLESISDISKSVYMELRMKSIEKNSEAMATGKLITKTIIKGAIGVLGIDANMSDDDLNKLYSSVNLNEKLLVFEDLERSDIDLIKLMGYINNLVERDGVKILLVANENEIIKRIHNTGNDNNSIPESDYLRIKEKTISDTINFECDYSKAIKNILKDFQNTKLQSLINNATIQELAIMVKGVCNKNFRTFIFATQKTVDIFDEMKENYDEDFLKCIYFGILCFSSKIKAEEFPSWEGTEFLSTTLGNKWYPLFKFCYDYMKFYNIDMTKVRDTKAAYGEMKLYDKYAGQFDEDLQKLYSYYERTEIEVRKVLKSIEKRLENIDDIGFYCYGKLATHLVIVSHVIGFDYSHCKKKMIENIKGKGESIDSELLFLAAVDFNGKEKVELMEFVKQLSESMNCTNSQNNFSYNPSDISNLFKEVLQNENKIVSRHEFISRYNASRIVDMLFCSSAKQICDFRDIMFAVYRYANKSDFIEADINTMKVIFELVKKGIESHNCNLDKIQLKQLEYLCSNLQTFISQMS